MADAVSGILGRPFAEQVAAFRLRLGDLRPTSSWTDLAGQDHDRAFMVAGAVKADLLADLAAAVDKAITEGTTLETFRADFREIVTRRGWHGWTGEGTTGGEAWRTRVIYRTNMATTYAAGRHAQLVAGGYAWWVYRHGGSAEPRLDHLSWDGVALPPDHPFWAQHYPPNGWGCSCRVFGARTRSGIRRVGGDPGKALPPGWDRISPRTGAPVGIDKGWNHAPGATVANAINAVVAKLPRLPAPLAAAVVAEMPAVAAAATPAPALPFQTFVPARSYDEAQRLAEAAGFAARIDLPGGAPLAGINDFLRTSMEAHQRFGLPPLDYWGRMDGFPIRTRPLPSSVPACYSYSATFTGLRFRVTALRAAEVTRGFTGALRPERIAAWREAVSEAAEGVQSRARRMTGWTWSTVTDPAGIAAHEWGHHFHNMNRGPVDRLIREHRMLEDGWPLLVSEYGRTNANEFVAEAFNLYLRGGEDQHWRLHPALLDFFRQKDRLHR